jgi:mannose/cellobiose epimerase-like protein (N-acyl-D-glucosamine 2-epimerase family)
VPNFRDRQFLIDHIQKTLAFYHPRSIDASGGFYHFLKDDGTVYDATTRHLVSSTRLVFNYGMACRHFGHDKYRDGLRHALTFLRDAHRDPATGGYAWTLKWENGKKSVLDGTNHCYGLAFVLLAYAHAIMAGEDSARPHLAETFDLMEKRFFEPQHGLYADEAKPDWSQTYPYRGQNANMHACEAMLAAYDATKETRYLDRAELLAHNITRRQAALANGMMWEHYHEDWSVDWEYNRQDKTNIFRPWGYQPGHLTEWAKLLLTLERHRKLEWLAPRAKELFDLALAKAWDKRNGGIFYGFGPEDEICDSDKYFWVQAESFAAAACLAQRLGNEAYWCWYDRIWDYAWRYFVDHENGAWYRILTHDNKKYSDEKSPAGKVDYHTMGAAYEVLGVI